MKCLIFSDSHRRGTEAMARVLSMHPDAEVVFFLGDGLSDLAGLSDPGRMFFTVVGNCDFFTDGSPEVGETVLCGKKIVFTHGHRYGAKSGEEGLLSLAVSRDADILLYGHTHRQSERYECVGERRIALFNPGSIAEGDFGLLTLTDTGFLLSHGHTEKG